MPLTEEEINLRIANEVKKALNHATIEKTAMQEDFEKQISQKESKLKTISDELAASKAEIESRDQKVFEDLVKEAMTLNPDYDKNLIKTADHLRIYINTKKENAKAEKDKAKADTDEENHSSDLGNPAPAKTGGKTKPPLKTENHSTLNDIKEDGKTRLYNFLRM